MSTVLNEFKQPTNADKDDNVLSLKGTVTGQSGSQAANVVDATDLGTAVTLVNSLKAALVDIGVMVPDA